MAEKADGRFTISENEFVEMCLTGTKQRPKLPIDFPDQIKFIITHAEDPCQFWIHLLEQVCAINFFSLPRIYLISPKLYR